MKIERKILLVFLLALLITVSDLLYAEQSIEEFIKDTTYQLLSLEKPVKLQNGNYVDDRIKVVLLKYAVKDKQIKKEDIENRLPDAVVLFLIEKDGKAEYEAVALIETDKGILQTNAVSLTGLMRYGESITDIRNVRFELYGDTRYFLYDPHIVIEVGVGKGYYSKIPVSLMLKKEDKQYRLVEYEPVIVK
ncbi:hypothetical protein [Thermodesulfovibrio hydrogeniphilus]